MNRQMVPGQKERLMAVLALVATQTAKIDVCPSDEKLAALVANDIRGQARERLLAHLNGCSQCYRAWLEAACHISAHGAVAPEPRRSWSLAERWQHYQPFFASWQLTMPTAAIALLVCLVVLWPPRPDLSAQIDESYAAVTAEERARAAQIAAALPLPWESAALAFDVAPVEPAARAFGAGLWTARAGLSNAAGGPLPEGLASPDIPSWRGSEYEVYYAFGRWTVLVWTLAQSPKTRPAWTEHEQILEVIRAKLKERPASEEAASLALAALDDIQPLLYGAKEARSNLSDALLITMQQLAPPSL